LSIFSIEDQAIFCVLVVILGEREGLGGCVDNGVLAGEGIVHALKRGNFREIEDGPRFWIYR